MIVGFKPFYSALRNIPWDDCTKELGSRFDILSREKTVAFLYFEAIGGSVSIVSNLASLVYGKFFVYRILSPFLSIST